MPNGLEQTLLYLIAVVSVNKSDTKRQIYENTVAGRQGAESNKESIQRVEWKMNNPDPWRPP